MGLFIALFINLEKNIWIMNLPDVIGLVLTIATVIGFGLMFIIILKKALKPGKHTSNEPKHHTQ